MPIGGPGTDVVIFGFVLISVVLCFCFNWVTIFDVVDVILGSVTGCVPDPDFVVLFGFVLFSTG